MTLLHLFRVKLSVDWIGSGIELAVLVITRAAGPCQMEPYPATVIRRQTGRLIDSNVAYDLVVSVYKHSF